MYSANYLVVKTWFADLLGEGKKGKSGQSFLEYFIEILVLLNVVAVVLETFEQFEAVYSKQLEYFEVFTVGVFTFEFLLRLWVSNTGYPPSKRWVAYKKHLLTWNSIIDIIAILPFFVPFMINIDLRHLRMLRLIRLLRAFKLTKYSQSMLLIGRIISEKRQELTATFFLMFSVLIIASSLIYFFERDAQPEVFPNIMHGFWWGIITLTTVGYGDVTPITVAGKVLGGFIAMTGVMIVAIPTAIISSSFVQKMEEKRQFFRFNEIRTKLKSAFYKKYIPELACKVRRGQLSVDTVKVELELSENEIYKIAEGKNEFRFRYKKVFSNGVITDKLFLEYREINTTYGTLNTRKHGLTLISPDSLDRAGIGYFAYCIAEKLHCSFVSNEFYGGEADDMEESFGDKGLDPESACNFRHNKGYVTESIPKEALVEGFEDWKADLATIAEQTELFLIFNTVEYDSFNYFVHLTYFKRHDTTTGLDALTISQPERIKAFALAVESKTNSKLGGNPGVSLNNHFQSIRENNLMLYLNETLQTDVLLINVHPDYLSSNKLFSFAALMADAIKEELLGVETRSTSKNGVRA